MSSLTKYIIPHRNTSTTIFVSLYHLVINSLIKFSQNTAEPPPTINLIFHNIKLSNKPY